MECKRDHLDALEENVLWRKVSLFAIIDNDFIPEKKCYQITKK